MRPYRCTAKPRLCWRPRPPRASVPLSRSQMSRSVRWTSRIAARKDNCRHQQLPSIRRQQPFAQTLSANGRGRNTRWYHQYIGHKHCRRMEGDTVQDGTIGYIKQPGPSAHIFPATYCPTVAACGCGQHRRTQTVHCRLKTGRGRRARRTTLLNQIRRSIHVCRYRQPTTRCRGRCRPREGARCRCLQCTASC